MKIKLYAALIPAVVLLSTPALSAVYQDKSATTIESGTLYAVIDSPTFFNLPYADIITANTNTVASGGATREAGTSPSWNFFIKGIQALNNDNKRTLSVRYRNLSEGSGNSIPSDSVEDRIGVIFTRNGEGTLLNGAAAIEMKMRYQDFDIMTENYEGVWPTLYPGFGSISTFYAYGIKFANLQKSFVAKYSGTDASGGLGLVTDNNSYGFNGSSGGVKINFGALWEFNKNWNMDGYFGVGVLTGLFSYNFNEKATTTLSAPNLTYDQGEKNAMWLVGDLEFELNLNAKWEFKNNQKAIFSIGYQGEELIKSSSRTVLGQVNGNNSTTLRDNFTLLAMKLSMAYQFV